MTYFHDDLGLALMWADPGARPTVIVKNYERRPTSYCIEAPEIRHPTSEILFVLY